VLTADALHLAAGAVWWGGLIGLVLVLAPGGDTSAERAAGTLVRFSAVAAWVLLALVATGTALAWRTLGTVDALVGTGYGRVLLAKITLVALVALLAAWNRWRLLPRFADRGRAPERLLLRRTVTVESSVLAVVVALTGVLVSQSPSDGGAPRATAAEAPASRSFEEPLGDGTLRATLTPGTRGVNALEFTVLGADGAPVDPVADPRVEVTLPEAGVGPLDPPASRTGTGRYTASVDLPLPGVWVVEVSVRTSTYEAPRAAFEVEVTG
jgi:copper transport protein